MYKKQRFWYKIRSKLFTIQYIYSTPGMTNLNVRSHLQKEKNNNKRKKLNIKII